MREIRFRGKRTDNGEWVEGMLARYNPKLFEVANIVNELDILVPVDIRTVGQYTGLTDKNGKKIFEGDIVEHHVQGDILVSRGVVKWDNKDARWFLQLRSKHPGFTMYKPDAYEVIGTIHDNPELLEVIDNA